MCGGVKYKDLQGKEWKTYFPNPKSALPILKSDGLIEWIKWGRHKEGQAPFVQVVGLG